LGKPYDELLFLTPFFMDLYFAAVDKIDAFDLFTFPEDQFPFFIVKSLSVGVDSRQPLGQTSFTEKTAF
jgi:hypothetical protein